MLGMNFFFRDCPNPSSPWSWQFCLRCPNPYGLAMQVTSNRKYLTRGHNPLIFLRRVHPLLPKEDVISRSANGDESDITYLNCETRAAAKSKASIFRALL